MSKKWMHDYLAFASDADKAHIKSKINDKIIAAIDELVKSRPIQPRAPRIRRTIDEHIQSALCDEEGGLHIIQIIARIERKGWRTTSPHNKYAQVYSALVKHYYIFERIGRGIFKLREGFRGRKLPPRPERIQQKDESKLITLNDIVMDIIRSRKSARYGMYAAEVHKILREVGYDESYASVYHTLQSKDFKRDGYFYTVARK